MWRYYRMSLRWMDGLGYQEWLLAGFGVLILGFILLRGFGSRTSY